jgi:hypothetical protein
MGERTYTHFYEWDGVAEEWIAEQFDSDFPDQPNDPGTSLAAHIIEDIFNLSLAGGSASLGSYLPGYDVKNRDPYQMIQLSLAAELKNERLVECYADGDGIVNFYTIGENISSINSGDVFYSISSESLSKKCDVVMVIGYDPPPKRKSINKVNPYDLLTFASLINDPDLPEDPDKFNYPIYHVWGDKLGAPELIDLPECKYYKQGYIEYGDPHFDQERVLIEAGVYDPKKYETVSTYIYKIEVPFFEQGSTSVQFSNRTPHFETLASMGTLQQRIWKEQDNRYRPSVCELDQEPSADAGVILPRSTERKFLGVREVYIRGYKITQLDIAAREGADGNREIHKSDGKTVFKAHLDSMITEPFRLSQGQDYIIKKSKNEEYYKIIFSCNVRPEYMENFGGALSVNQQCYFTISPSSIYDAQTGVLVPYIDPYDWGSENKVSGVLKDIIGTPVDSETIHKEAVFPLGEGRSAYVVKQIVLIYDWDNPCIAINDELNQCTEENLKLVKAEFYPIIMQDKPAPVATDAGSLDPTEMILDYDVTTTERPDLTNYARAFASLESGDIKVTLPFLYTNEGSVWESDECVKVAQFIKSLQNEVVESTTYICSPDSEPILGEKIEGKTINSIDYSYQDSSQYLISVQAGPVWQGIQGWDTSIYQNKTERIQLEGVVIYVPPDNATCSVKIEQLGLMECINGSKDVLEKGDRVSVTVYNNPVAK